MNEVMLQTIKFANVTVENMMASGSITITTVISVVAIVISFLTLWFTHLRGMRISVHPEYELPELSANKFKNDIPISLPVKVNLSVLNSGNRAGIVKDFDLKFIPESNFERFYRDIGGKFFSIKAAETDQSVSTISIKDQDTKLVTFDGFINLDWRIQIRDPLRTIIIESDNLKTLLEEMLKYKKDLLEEFITFLKGNEKLGDLIISYSYTTERIRRKHIVLPSQFIEFKKETPEPLEVKHSYKKAIELYEKSLENYQLSSHPAEIINKILRRINSLEKIFDECLEFLKKPREEANLRIPLNNILWMNEILNKEDNEIELLTKCRNYKKTIEDDVKPLLDKLLIDDRKVGEAYVAPTEEIKQRSFEEIKRDRVKLREKLEDVSPKLEEIKKEVEKEFSEMSSD